MRYPSKTNMADNGFNVQDFSPNGELIDIDDEDGFVRNDTQVLNLEDDQHAMSEVRGSTAEMDGGYPNSDEDLPVDENDEEPQIQVSLRHA